MGLPFIFGKKKEKENIDITNEELKEILNSSTHLISSDAIIKSEIINIAPSRELNHLKRRMWKFYHK